MGKLFLKSVLIAITGMVITGCSKPLDIETSKQQFFSNEEVFQKLSNVACAFSESNNINFFRYPLDVQGEYAEKYNSEFDEFEDLLDATDLELLVIRDRKGWGCELSVLIDGTSFLGEGVSLSYVYHPSDLGNYQYTEDFFNEDIRAKRDAIRTRGDDVKFSIELTNGWYLQYYRYP